MLRPGTRFKGRRWHSPAPTPPAHLPANPSSTASSGRSITRRRDPPRSPPPPGSLPSRSPAGRADTQRGCIANHERLTSNTGGRVSHAPGEILQHIRQLLLTGSCKCRAEAFCSCKATPWAARPSQHPALAWPETIPLATSMPGGKGWAAPREALSQGAEKPRSFTWELLRASPALHAASAEAVTTAEREASNRYAEFPRSQMLFGSPAVSHKDYKSTKNPPRSRHLSKGEGRSEREEKGRLFIQRVM